MKNLKLKAARAFCDMSQQDLADKVGVSRQTINAIEKGDYNPTINLCIAICKVLGKTLDELFWDPWKDMLEFYKENKNDKIRNVHDTESRGPLLFSFDKKKIFNMWEEQKALSDKENPFWADFFKERYAAEC